MAKRTSKTANASHVSIDVTIVATVEVDLSKTDKWGNPAEVTAVEIDIPEIAGHAVTLNNSLKNGFFKEGGHILRVMPNASASATKPAAHKVNAKTSGNAKVASSDNMPEAVRAMLPSLPEAEQIKLIRAYSAS